MRVVILPDYDAASTWAAAYVAHTIRTFNPTRERPFVLGLPTGSTPLGMYRDLIRMYREGILSFANVVTFNLDEYAGLPEDHPQSYHTFMREHFFRHIDIPPGNVHIPNGNALDLERECREYELAIARFGGVELFVGGAGPNGHIAFNEPGSSLSSRTRVVTLARDTIIANSRFFGGDVEKVPRTALTVGIGTILDARNVLLIAAGRSKAHALRMGVEEGVNAMWPVSSLQLHPRAVIVCNEDAAVELNADTVRRFMDSEREKEDPSKSLLTGQ